MADYDAQPDRPVPADAELSSAQRDADELDLHAGLSGVTGIVAGTQGVIETLREVAEFAVQAIPSADGAGVALVHSSDDTLRIRARAVTAAFVDDIDAVQYEVFDEGPCITCARSRRPTVSGSLGSDNRWPHFGGRVARMGVHSALALPLIIGDRVIGVINSYARQRDAFTEHAVQSGAQFAGPAAVSVYSTQLLADARERAGQLQQALGSRAVIDQAIGIIRSRSGLSAQEAFERLTRTSQHENVKLHVVAERLVDEAVRRAQARHR